MLYAREGAKIFAVDIDEAAVAETKRIIENEGGVCAIHTGDAMKADQVEAMVNACMGEYGVSTSFTTTAEGRFPEGRRNSPRRIGTSRSTSI